MIPAIGKVLHIGLVRPAIPFAREHASAADCLKAEPQAANAGKQVDEPELCCGHPRNASCRDLAYPVDHKLRGNIFTRDITPDLPYRDAELHLRILQRQAGSHKQAAKTVDHIMHAPVPGLRPENPGQLMTKWHRASQLSSIICSVFVFPTSI